MNAVQSWVQQWTDRWISVILSNSGWWLTWFAEPVIHLLSQYFAESWQLSTFLCRHATPGAAPPNKKKKKEKEKEIRQFSSPEMNLKGKTKSEEDTRDEQDIDWTGWTSLATRKSSWICPPCRRMPETLPSLSGPWSWTLQMQRQRCYIAITGWLWRLSHLILSRTPNRRSPDIFVSFLYQG